MTSIQSLAATSELRGVEAASALAARGEQMREDLWESTRQARQTGDRVRLAAVGLTDSRAVVWRWSLRARNWVRNSQVRGGFDRTGRTSALNAQARRRGVRLEHVVREVTARQFPLLPLTGLHNDVIAVAPVRFAMIVLDGRHLGFAGPTTNAGEPTLWLTSDPGLVAHARELGSAQVEMGLRVQPLPPTPVNARRLQVLIHLLNGLTDAAIARRLEVSMRLVERDVQAIKVMAGVTTRMEIAWCLGHGDRAP